jgi:hypothetical protein
MPQRTKEMRGAQEGQQCPREEVSTHEEVVPEVAIEVEEGEEEEAREAGVTEDDGRC